jgi:hypothetical protein
MDRVLLALKRLYETCKCCCGGEIKCPGQCNPKLGALNLFVASVRFLSFLLFLFSPLLREISTVPNDTDKTWHPLKMLLFLSPLSSGKVNYPDNTVKTWHSANAVSSGKVSWFEQYRQSMALSRTRATEFFYLLLRKMFKS